MKYIRQLCIIMLVSLAGEAVKAILPFPIPASIYGLVIMLVLLMTKALPLDKVEETADFLVSIMPVMFIPAAVGIMGAWGELKPVLVPTLVILAVTTVLVMAVTGRVTQFLMKMRKGGR